jgi:hypothetical protein
MKELRNEKGFVKFVFVVLLLALSIYVGYQFGMPYYRYSAFKTDVKELARISVGEAEKTKAQIVERAKELNIPIEEKEIMVSKTEKTVRVKTSWTETVDILGYYQKQLHFTVNVEE